ncbi:MAG: histidinol dehydrogenase [Deltaproteobacteria bacterium]|nr:histidinol dehydrogenase [Deltaproteobacteria bacterium]
MLLRILDASGAPLERLCRRGEADLARVEPAVREILDRVQREGDEALVTFAARFEGRAQRPTEIEIPPGRVRAAAASVAAGTMEALRFAAGRIRAFHERAMERERDLSFEEGGVELGQLVTPLASAGVYAPGGKARYPSTVLMAAVPAAVAGVAEVVLCSPSPTPEVLAAASIAGVARVFDVGGAQAIAAMAFGTETIPAVDAIVGPGNLYVACAKKLVSGRCAIDGIAGPSEAVVLADDHAVPSRMAADLLTQAEHDEEAYAILVTTSRKLAAAVQVEVERQVASLPRRAIAERSLADKGAILVAEDLDTAVSVCSRIAPEHLTIVTADPAGVLAKRPVAGCIFVGPDTPQTAGDYVAGPSHVLPTGGAARFGAPLGVHHFLRRSSLVRYTSAALEAQAEPMTSLARLEGLEAHARAVEIRLARGPRT